MAKVAELGLTNVTLLPGVPRDEVPRLLAAADICLVPLRDVPLFSSFIPSKMFEYLAASKAVVGSVRGEPAAILEAAGAVVVEPEDSGRAGRRRPRPGRRSGPPGGDGPSRDGSTWPSTSTARSWPGATGPSCSACAR